MRKSQRLFLNDQSVIKSESFVDLCRGDNPHVLIRRRKMPTEDVLDLDMFPHILTNDISKVSFWHFEMKQLALMLFRSILINIPTTNPLLQLTVRRDWMSKMNMGMCCYREYIQGIFRFMGIGRKVNI